VTEPTTCIQLLDKHWGDDSTIFYVICLFIIVVVAIQGLVAIFHSNRKTDSHAD
jgi:hypothetical protein